MSVVRSAEHHEVMAVIGKPKPEKRAKKTHSRKVSERKRWERKLDEITREIVLERDGHCVLFGNHMGARQCGHLVTRAKKSVRWDLRNCNEQCGGCNLRHEYYPEVYTSWYLSNFGECHYKKLFEDSEVVRKLTIDELETLYINMVEIQKRMEDKKFAPRFSQAEILAGTWKERI